MKKLSPLLLVSLLTGCMVGPDYHIPPSDIPENWENKTPCNEKKPQDIQQEITWWENFKDPILTQLVKEAIESNYDLKIALARIEEARATLLGGEAQLFPEIDAFVSYTRNQRSLNSQGNPQQDTPGTSTGSQRRFNLYRGGELDTIWELDLFGRLSRNVEPAEAIVEARADDMYGGLLTLIADVAVNYINLCSFQKQLDITQKSFQAWDHIYKLNQSLLTAGLTTDIEVAQAEAARDQTEANLSPL